MNLKDFKTMLENEIETCERVFIAPHIGADFDAIASCLAMALIVSKFDKEFYILLDEEASKIEPGVKKIVDEVKDSFPIIKMDKFLDIANIKEKSNDLLILCDVNRKHLLCCEDYLSYFKNICVIDHHDDVDGILNTIKYVNVDASSASEILTELLSKFQIKYSDRIADYLLAGIYLDTNKFTKHISAKTMVINSKLIRKGADLDRVNLLFKEDFESDRKVQNLVGEAKFLTYTVALAISDDRVKFTKEELAKVADYLLKFSPDISISAGYIDNENISISARSRGNINVGEVMRQIGGGGNIYSGASRISDEDISEVSKKLNKILVPDFYIKK